MSEKFDESEVEVTQILDLDQEVTAMIFSKSRTQELSNQEKEKFKAYKQSYVLLKQIGEGAMGQIQLVKDQSLQRNVAYKQLHPDMVGEEKVLNQFLNEVQITAQLEHPNIVPIYSFEMTSEGMGYAMKLVRGKTLKDLINETKRAFKQSKHLALEYRLEARLEHFIKVCDAVDYAHSKGIIHRDLKPANIMIGAYNEIYVMDWGIARRVGPQEHEAEEESKHAIGTPRYMSPEQARGLNTKLDGRSDQFSLAIILYELICLKQAYTSKKTSELFKQVLKADKDPIEGIFHQVKVPKELKAIINKATSLKRAHRYDSVREMIQDIQRFLRGEAVLAEKDSLLQSVLRWMNRHRQLTLGAVFTVICLSSVFTVWSLYKQQQTLLASREREHHLGKLLSEASHQGQKIDGAFLKAHALLYGLSGAFKQALLHSSLSSEPYYIDNATWSSKVPDLIPTSHYGGEISLNYTGFSIAYTVKEEAVKSQLQQLIPLRHFFKHLLIKSQTGGKPLPEPRVRQLIAEDGVPIMFASATTREGVLQYYPGKGYDTPNYDPRIRPFYKLAKNKRGIQCGNPFVDKLTGAMFSCSLAMYDSQQKMLGVSSLDFQFNALAKIFLDIPVDPAFVESFLLDDKAQIIVRSSDKNRQIKTQKKLNYGLKLKLFEDTKMIRKIQNKRFGGYVEAGAHTYAYYRLQSLGWYYVVKVDTEKLFSTPIKK